MPLIVHCPSGCIIRVPKARAGTIVRCSECKALIQLRSLLPEEFQLHQSIEIRAIRASSEHDAEGFPLMVPSVPGGLPPGRPPETEFPPPLSSTGRHKLEVDHRDLPADDADVGPPAESDPGETGQLDPFELPVPQPARLRFSLGRRKRSRTAGRKHPPARSAATEGLNLAAPHAPDLAPEFSIVDWEDESGGEPSEDEYRFLSQFFAICIGILGTVLIIPSLLAWGGWSALPVQPLGSRWIFIMIFIGGLHWVYAIYLFQIQERAALLAVALFLLAVACVQAVFTAGTWLDGGLGPISRYLQLPPGETAMVTFWCFLHLTIAVVLCYLCGRQAFRWQHKSHPSRSIAR